MNQLNTFVLASAALLACAISHVEGIVDSDIDVSPTAVSGRRSFGVRSSSYLPTGAVLGVSNACQLNFSYVSDQPVSVWFSLEGYAQTLLVLPNGRPCVNKTTCTASAFIDRHKQYVLLAEYLPEVSGSSANVVLNFSAAIPSASGSLSSAVAELKRIVHSWFCNGCFRFATNLKGSCCFKGFLISLTSHAGCGVVGPGSVVPVSDSLTCD